MGLRQPGTNRVGFRRVGPAASTGAVASNTGIPNVAGTSSPYFAIAHIGTPGTTSGKSTDLMQMAGFYGSGLPNTMGSGQFATPTSTSQYKENALMAIGHIMPRSGHVDAIGYYFVSGVGNGELALNVYRMRTDGLCFPGALICSTGHFSANLATPTATTYQEFTSVSIGTLPFAVTAGEMIFFGIVGGTRLSASHNGPTVGMAGMLYQGNTFGQPIMGIIRVASGTDFATGAAAHGDFRGNAFSTMWRSDDTSFANGASGSAYTPPDPFPEINLVNMAVPFLTGATSAAISPPCLFFHIAT